MDGQKDTEMFLREWTIPEEDRAKFTTALGWRVSMVPIAERRLS
jgi:hypothetical protein